MTAALWFGIGLTCGACFGIMLASALCAASAADDASARIAQRAVDRFDAYSTNHHPFYHPTRYATIAEMIGRVVEVPE